MNINLGLSKNYEMNSLADPAKTKPILPGLKRQLYRTNLSHSLESPDSKGEHSTTCQPEASSRGTPPPPTALTFPPPFIHNSPPGPAIFAPQIPHFNVTTFVNFHTLKHLFQRHSTTFLTFPLFLHTFSNVNRCAFASILTLSPSTNFSANSSAASRFSNRCWIVRFNGRAPKTGS